MRKLVQNFFSDVSGGTAIEYALIGSLIAMAIIAGMTAIYSEVGNTMNGISNEIVDATEGKYSN